MAYFKVTAVLKSGRVITETYDSYNAESAEDEVDLYIPDVAYVESVEEF